MRLEWCCLIGFPGANLQCLHINRMTAAISDLSAWLWECIWRRSLLRSTSKGELRCLCTWLQKITSPLKSTSGGATDTSIPDLQALSACRAAGPCSSLSWCLDVAPAQEGFAHVCPHLLGSTVCLVFLRLNPSYLGSSGDASPISMKLLGGHQAAMFSE